MELFSVRTNIDFLKQAPRCALISAMLCALVPIIVIAGWATTGRPLGAFNLGIEFAGGTVLEIQAAERALEEGGAVDIAEVRTVMGRIGYPEAQVVRFDDPEEGRYRISLPQSEEDGARAPAAAATTDTKGDAAGTATPPASGTAGGIVAENGLVESLLDGLRAELGTAVVAERVESIGPRIGAEFALRGVLAIAVVGLLILLYIWVRFDVEYAPGAVAALLHDITITTGVFLVLQLEFNLQVLAALLVVLGYSLNDTIVVYDRIRENVELRGVTLLRDVVNQSINQTLSRTLLTSLTTMLVVFALVVFGGRELRDFALALMIGVVVGTYSTIYVASAFLVYMQKLRGKAQGATAHRAGARA
jgi:preprotein translocase SecF subunit